MLADDEAIKSRNGQGAAAEAGGVVAVDSQG